MLVALLLAIAISLTLTAWIPQRASSDVDYARWLSQTQARFGEATSVMRMLGLFSIIPSLGFRTLLSLLSGCVLLRLAEGLDRLQRDQEITKPDGEWQRISAQQLRSLLYHLRRRRYRVLDATSFSQIDRWPWSGVFSLITHLAVLLLLFSLLLSHLFGWQVSGIILQEGERRSLPGGDHWVSLTRAGSGTRHSPGVVTFIEESGPGVQVSAVDGDGESLQVLLTPEADPSTELKIPLTGDTYFAIPEAELIVRLTPRSKESYTRADVQIYGSPTGEIISEMVTEAGGQAQLDVEDVTLTFTPAPYARVVATRNPGRLLAGLSLVMLVLGLVGSLMWSERRFWLREGDVSIEAVGALPPWLLRDQKAL
jgi:hypothetical protein